MCWEDLGPAWRSDWSTGQRLEVRGGKDWAALEALEAERKDGWDTPRGSPGGEGLGVEVRRKAGAIPGRVQQIVWWPSRKDSVRPRPCAWDLIWKKGLSPCN